MSRPRGGFLGYTPQPAASAANSAAGGIWTLREAEELKRAGTWPFPTPPFSPTSLSGLQAWYDASDASTLYDATTGGSLVAADGGVARWEDKSGNDYHMTQGTAGSRPARKTAIQGGLDVLRFDGSNDYLVAGTASTFTFLHSSTSSWFVAFRAGDVEDPDTFYFLCGTSGTVISPGGAYIRHETRDSLSQTGIVHVSGGDGNRSNNYRSGPGGNVYQVASLVSDQTESLAENRSFLRVNGGAAATESVSTAALNTADPRDGFGVGALKGSSNTYAGFLVGDICEIIIYDSALSDTDREAVENYLLAKWGIEPAPVPSTSVEVEYLVVAGGGGGGKNYSAGGGAGGYRESSAYSVSAGIAYTVTVGAGGAGSTGDATGGKGGDSVFDTITSTGGGGGGSADQAGASGGSGGGGGYNNNTGGAGNTPSTSPSQGNNGGGGAINGPGGGGGANAVGGTGSNGAAGAGGAGKASSITGTSVTRAGGGGGGIGQSGSVGAGGAGGGGQGGQSDGSVGQAGTANTGGGGGGGGSANANGGSGGSGVVIIRAPQAAASTTGSPTVTTDGGDTIYTFTGSGSITF